MDESNVIQPGKTYQVTVDDSELRVKALKPALESGWWLCETPDGQFIKVQSQRLAPQGQG